MKEQGNNEIKNKNKRRLDKGQIFGKIMAGMLAIMMLLATAATLIYSLI